MIGDILGGFFASLLSFTVLFVISFYLIIVTDYIKYLFLKYKGEYISFDSNLFETRKPLMRKIMLVITIVLLVFNLIFGVLVYNGELEISDYDTFFLEIFLSLLRG